MAWYSRFLPNNELRSFHIDIDKVFCPYVYPCIAESNNIKRKWLKWGTENNIRIINKKISRFDIIFNF